MSGLAKVFIVLNFVLSIVFLASAGVLLAKSDEWRTKYTAEVDARKLEADGLNRRITEQNGTISATSSDRDKFKGDLSESQTAREKYKGDWEAEQKANAALRQSVEASSATLKTIQATLASAQEQIGAMQKGKEEAESKMREAVEKQRVAEAEVTRLSSEGEDKQAQIEKLGLQISTITNDLDKSNTVIEMARTAGFEIDKLMAQPAINGKVVEVDSRAGVVVLSVGQQAEVKKGYRFHVYRGRDYIGEIMVDDVYPDLSAASVVKLKPGMEIQKLDEVTTRL